MNQPFFLDNRILYRAIAAGDRLPPLTEEQEKIVIERGDMLSLRFMRQVLFYAGKRTMRSMVHAAQSSACLLLGYLHRRQQKNGNSSFLFARLEQCLGSFIKYLRSDFTTHFQHKSPMPLPLWLPVKELALEVIGTDEHTALSGDEALREALVKTLEENATPCWIEGDYWQRLTARLAELPRNNAFRVAYTLISWNFNSVHFVDYMLRHYQLSLTEEIHPRRQWQDNRLALMRVTETQHYALYPFLPSCRSLLLARIDNEISACEFIDHVPRKEPPIALPLSVPQIGAMLRIMYDTDLMETTNITAMLTRVADMFTSKRGGQISAHSLRQKFYYPESAALSIIETQLSRLLKECKKQSSGSFPGQ
jgi:hypothetical protein